MQTSSNKTITDKESILIGAKFLHAKYLKLKEDDYTYYLYRRLIKRQCPDKKYIRQVLFIAKFIIENKLDKNSYKDLMKEIISEFHLYDFYD